MQLVLSTWPEIEDYLRRSDAIIVPVGSTEQHGPNGLIGTDMLCAQAVAKGVGEATGTLVAPVLSVGMAQHHMAFPGTMTLRPSTLIAVVKDWVASLARHGFRRFFFINGHGGNIASLDAAFSELHTEASLSGRPGELRFCLRNWWASPKVDVLSKELYGRWTGAHATPPEVAVTQFLHPEAIKQVEMAPPSERMEAFADAADYRRLYPDGRIASDPSLATPEAGGRLLAASVEELSQELRRFLAG